MIQISENLYYDETKSFLEQEDVIKNFLINKTETIKQDYIENEENSFSYYPRPIYYKWIDKDYDYTLLKRFNYKHDSRNVEAAIVSNYEYIVENNTWLENEKKYQIKQSFENMLNMLEEYPKMGEYRKTANIKTYSRNGQKYFYVNWFEQYHRELLIIYGAQITENINYIGE